VTSHEAEDHEGVALNADDIEAVCLYMNSEVPEAVEYIAQKLGGVGRVGGARLVGMTSRVATLEILIDSGATVAVDIPWSAPVVDRVGMREQLFALLDHASVR
jgi:hypothetical protein